MKVNPERTEGFLSLREAGEETLCFLKTLILTEYRYITRSFFCQVVLSFSFFFRLSRKPSDK